MKKSKQFHHYDFDPLTASVPCRAWFDFSDSSTITLSGSFIVTADDKSGNGNHVTQGTAGNRPTQVTLNRKQVALFDGNNDSLQKTSPVGTSGFPNISVYAVIRPVASDDGTIIGIGTSGNPWGLRQINPFIFNNVGFSATGSGSHPSVPITFNETIIVVGKFTGATSLKEVLIFGGNDASSNDGGTSIPLSTDNLNVGGPGFNGYMMELIVFIGLLSDLEESKLLNNLSGKWL